MPTMDSHREEHDHHMKHDAAYREAHLNMTCRRAINVADLLYPDMKIGVDFMLAPVTGMRQHRRMDPSQLDSDAVILDCGGEQAAAIVDFLRRIARRHGRVLRSYVEGARGGWKEVRA